MRLQILDRGHGFATKLLFAFIRTVSRQPVLDVVKLVKYRADFYGNPMAAVTQEAMRGPSSWSVADRELMAAHVAQNNHSSFCTKAHCAVAQRAYGGSADVAELLSDPDLISIAEPLRATLVLLGKLTRQQFVEPSDIQQVIVAGASPNQIEDALAVCFSFNVIGRLADAFGFSIPGDQAFDAGAKYLLARGYR